MSEKRVIQKEIAPAVAAAASGNGEAQDLYLGKRMSFCAITTGTGNITVSIQISNDRTNWFEIGARTIPTAGVREVPVDDSNVYSKYVRAVKTANSGSMALQLKLLVIGDAV